MKSKSLTLADVTTAGRKDVAVHPDIGLDGLGIEPLHCKFVREVLILFMKGIYCPTWEHVITHRFRFLSFVGIEDIYRTSWARSSVY
jgi:hypothetical protein